MLQNIVAIKKIHYFGAHFTEIRGFAMKEVSKLEKNGQNDVTHVKLFVMAVKSLLEVQNTNNSESGCY